MDSENQNTMERLAFGLVAGRFQPLHLGHVEYIMAALRRCDHLFVGITHPDPGKDYKSRSDRHRHKQRANPFAYDVRQDMVYELMKDQRISTNEYDIVPVRLEDTDDVRRRVSANTTVFVTVYNDWGEEKKGLLESMGFRVEELWRRRETVTSGMDVRSRIENFREWEHLVPPSTSRVVRSWLEAGNVINGSMSTASVR
jgi:cytidyltransferase-like protein